MNWFGSLTLLSLLIVQSGQAQEVPLTVSPKKHYHVRVLLNENTLKESFEWKIGSPTGFWLIDPDAKVRTRIENNELTIRMKNKIWHINNTPWNKKKAYLCPCEGHLQWEGKEYQGNFLVTTYNQNAYLINSIDIEEYVCSVLRTESWPGWPLEVNKAFAIASRSYVIGIILGNHASKLPYHVKNTNKHQTYTGLHTNPILKEAVEQTRGIFIAYDKKPIIAMFDSCCGGVIPAHIHGANFANAPYLARSYACTFCKDCRMYNWKARYPIANFEGMLKKEYRPLKKIQKVKVSKYDKAGLVQQISVQDQHKYFSIPGKKIYSLFSQVKSFCFDVVLEAKEIVFTGKGMGHHLGLCQWGAREMVRQGYDYKSILNFYYPHTSFMRLSN